LILSNIFPKKAVGNCRLPFLLARQEKTSGEKPMPALYTPIQMGTLSLPNRIVMAPMTRSRALGNVPNKLMETYYRLRADAGLIITEGTAPSPDGLGYARIPGLYSAQQIAGWRKVTDAVHGAGGRIFVQLMHTGRVGHPANLPKGARLLAPSAIAAPGEMWTDTAQMQPHPEPLAMNENDIAAAIEAFAAACRNAIGAGFDGVELHGANGYLIDQFLNTASNRRVDRWGGSVDNRIRFAVAVAEAAADAIGADHVGMRISPYGVFNGMAPDTEMDTLYEHLTDALNEIGLLYIHVVDHSSMGAPPVSDELKAKLRGRFRGRYILSGGYDAIRANADLEAAKGDLVAFGRPFIANPDLVQKMATGTKIAAPDPATFYTPDAKGYTEL
jgi:N-ethylmaleimide reductase